jgi:two-component system KDP operon response regulator KdpE
MIDHQSDGQQMDIHSGLSNMRSKTILVIEDDADVRLGYHVLLKAHHYDTVLAAEGVAALREAHQHKPDLIILDLGLPTADGFMVVQWFRSTIYLSLIPIVVVSSRDLRGNKERALSVGAKAFLQKPWDDRELMAIIGRLIGRGHSRHGMN